MNSPNLPPAGPSTVALRGSSWVQTVVRRRSEASATRKHFEPVEAPGLHPGPRLSGWLSGYGSRLPVPRSWGRAAARGHVGQVHVVEVSGLVEVRRPGPLACRATAGRVRELRVGQQDRQASAWPYLWAWDRDERTSATARKEW